MTENNTIYIIFRRAYHEDDLDYGTFKPFYISLNLERVTNVFNNLCNNITRDPLAENIKEILLTSIEYYRKHWYYEFRLERYELDKFCTFEKK